MDFVSFSFCRETPEKSTLSSDHDISHFRWRSFQVFTGDPGLKLTSYIPYKTFNRRRDQQRRSVDVEEKKNHTRWLLEYATKDNWAPLVPILKTKEVARGGIDMRSKISAVHWAPPRLRLRETKRLKKKKKLPQERYFVTRTFAARFTHAVSQVSRTYKHTHTRTHSRTYSFVRHRTQRAKKMWQHLSSY